jgi:hypothetical protein
MLRAPRSDVCMGSMYVWSVTRRDRADLETGIIVNDVKAGVLLGEPPAAPPLMLASTARSTIARGNAGERTTNRFIPTLRLIAQQREYSTRRH